MDMAEISAMRDRGQQYGLYGPLAIFSGTANPGLAQEIAERLNKPLGKVAICQFANQNIFARLDETYPQGVNWQVAVDSLAFPDVPSHEQDMPNFLKAQDRFGAFFSLIQSTPGLDIDAEIDTLEGDLQTIFSEAGG